MGYKKAPISFLWKSKISKLYNILSSKYFVENITALTLVRFISYGINFANLYCVTTILSIDEYGYVAYITSVFALISIFGIPGFDTVINLASSKNRDFILIQCIKRSIYFSLIPMVGFFIYGGFLWYSNHEFAESILFMVGSISFPLYYGLNGWQSFLAGKKRFKTIAFNNLFINVTSTLIPLLSLYVNNNKYLYVLLILLTQAGTNLIIYLRTTKQISSTTEAVNLGEIKYGYKLTAIAAGSILLKKLDNLLIANIVSLHALGTYYLAKRIFDIFSETIKIMVSVMSQKLVGREKKKYLADLKKYIKSIMFLSLFVSLLFTLVGSIVLKYMFNDYKDSFLVHLILSMVFIFAPLAQLFSKYFLFNNLFKYTLVIEFSWMLLQTTLFILLIPIWGQYGAALSTLLVAIYSTLISLYFAFSNKGQNSYLYKIYSSFYGGSK